MGTTNSQELSTDAQDLVSTMIDSILNAAFEIGLSYEKMNVIMEVMDTVSEIQSATLTADSSSSSSGSSSDLLGRKRRLSTKSAVTSTISVMADLITNDMVVGQENVEQVQTNYRMSGIATSATAGMTLNYTVPRSDYEIASNTMVSSIAFDPAASSENLQMVVSETASKLFDMDVEDTGDGSFNDTSMNSISNALKMRLDCTASGVSDQAVYFQIPHLESQYFGVDEAF